MSELDRGDEEVYESNVGSEEDIYFDAVMGALQEILMSGDFAELQSSFCREYSGIFDDAEENKHEYIDVFQKYSSKLENHIEKRLVQKFQGFSMKEFTGMLVARKDEMDGDVFDLLFGLSDFVEFKSMMLAYKKGLPLGFELGGQRAEIAAHK